VSTEHNDARPVTVGVSQEVNDINVALQLVRTSRISGRVMNPDGTMAKGLELQAFCRRHSLPVVSC